MNMANLIRANISKSQLEEAIASTHNISSFFHLCPIKDCCLGSIFVKILPILLKMSRSQGLLPLPWRKNYTDRQLSVPCISQDIFPDILLNVPLQNFTLFLFCSFLLGKGSSLKQSRSASTHPYALTKRTIKKLQASQSLAVK